MHFNSVKPRVWLALATIIGIGLLSLAGVWSLTQTRQSIRFLRQLDFEQAALAANQAHPVAAFFTGVTFHQVGSLEAWSKGTDLIGKLPSVLARLSPFAGPEASLDTQALSNSESVGQLAEDSLLIATQLDRSWIFSRFFPDESKRITTIVSELETIVTSLLKGEHTYLVVFQNTDELRPTGGFMGTYGLVTLREGHITDLSIQDIYEPDGQFTGYVEAPTGVKEYLSSGNGLRLPDANWWTDWPSSAQKILPFFALGNKQAAEGVIAINLSVAENVLHVLGPVYVPDYQTTVTAENLAQVARADRESFFPGSQSKPHFLSSLFNQLKFKLGDLTTDQKKELARQLFIALKTKQIQLYTNQEGLQKIFEKYHFAGQATTSISPTNPDWYLFLTEANVGINKANRQIQRAVELELSDYRSLISIKYMNQNSVTTVLSTEPSPTPAASNSAVFGAQGARHFHYFNYQRVLLLPTTEVKSIVFNGEPLSTWSSVPIKTSTGEEFKEIGFLVEVPESSEALLTLEITHPQLPSHPTLLLQKQSGIDPTPYHIQFGTQIKTLLLEQDQVLSF